MERRDRERLKRECSLWLCDTVKVKKFYEETCRRIREVAFLNLIEYNSPKNAYIEWVGKRIKKARFVKKGEPE